MTTYGPDFNGVVRSVPDRSSAEPENQAEALKRCPFCGSDALGHGHSYPPEQGDVQCYDCGGAMIAPTEDEAIAAWNRRTPTVNYVADDDTHPTRVVFSDGRIVSVNPDGSLNVDRAYLASLPEAPAVPVAASIKPLEWEYHERPVYTYTARDERGLLYHINQGFGSDSYYFATVRFDGVTIYDGEDLPSAKAAAQADFETRIRSALQSSPPAVDGEVDRLRKALIAAGRHVGAGLADDVSTDFLMLVPEEVRLVMERHRAALASQPAAEGEAVAWRWRHVPWVDWSYGDKPHPRENMEQQPLYARPVGEGEAVASVCGIASPSYRDCPNMKEVGGGFEGERYRCAVCGKGYFLDYEDMK